MLQIFYIAEAGRAGYQPAPNFWLHKERAVDVNTAKEIYLSKKSVVEQTLGITGASKAAYNAALNGNKTTAVVFGTLAIVASTVTAMDLVSGGLQAQR